MKALKGLNLGERQHDINEEVNFAIWNKIDFDLVKDDGKVSDVDVIFKIDLASKLKNINFIISILKSGDDFAITRALNKCTFFGDDVFTKYINTEYVKHDIFPTMSIKQKKKFLLKLSKSLKDEKRLKDFHQLCREDETLRTIALKFLQYTSESYKIEQAIEQFTLIPIEGKHFTYLIGNSFTLAQNFLNTLTQPSQRNYILYTLRNMYTVCDYKYLSLLETFYDVESQCNRKQRFGLRLSKNIILKNKDRVYENPFVYMNILNTKVITRHSTRDEAELFACSVLPADVTSFWLSNYCEVYKCILDIVKHDEKFSFVKRIFTDKYPGEDFDESINFYFYKLYNLMTVQEKEDWALRHIASGQELLGSGHDYKWYEFVTFDKAFEYLQKSIWENTTPYQRLDMFLLLIDSAKSQQDLEKILQFYYSEISKESNQNTEKFLNKVIIHNEVLKLNEGCWAALEKLFCSLGVFDKSNYRNDYNEYITITLMYKIINGKEVPEILNDLLSMDLIYFPSILNYEHQITAEMMEKIYLYIANYYTSKINQTIKGLLTEEKKRDLNKYLYCVLDLMSALKKTKDDIPSFMNNLMLLDWEKFQYHALFISSNTFGEGIIRRHLKTNAALVVNEFHKIQDYFNNRLGNINWLLKKIRTYFSNDIGKIYVNKFKTCLCSEDLSKVTAVVAVRGILTLADVSDRVSFLEEYIPKNHAMADNDKLSQRVLNIRLAICKQVSYSRPPLPLSRVMFYIAAYTSYCYPMFYNYSINLPEPLFLEFVNSLIDQLPSVRKTGMMLALKYFKTELLNTFIIDTWRKTTDPSLRAIIYIHLMKKFRNSTLETQQRLFGALEYCTEDLKEDDNEEIFIEMSVSSLPKNFRGTFLVAAWKAVSKFTDKSSNSQRFIVILQQINDDISIVPQEILDDIISSHVNQMLDDKQILNNHIEEQHHRIIKAKWDLIARNFSYVIGEQELSKNLDLAKFILTKCVEMWNEVRNDIYVIREFCVTFLMDVDNYSYTHNVDVYFNVNLLFKSIIEHLEHTLPDNETYLLIWNLRLSVKTKKILSVEVSRERINDDPALLFVNCVIKVSEAFGKIMKEYIGKNKYFPSFHAEIENILMDKIMKLKNCIDKENHIHIDLTDLIVLSCTGLVQYTLPEVYMFMLRILPTNYSDTYVTEYKSVIKTIKSFSNDEIKYFLYDKYVNSGFSNFIDTL